MIQRLRVRGIKVQRRDGNGPGKNRRVIRVRLNVSVDSLFEQPEVTAAPRIFSFRELIARDLLRLPRESYFAVPRLRHIHVEQHLIRQPFLQNHFRRRLCHPRRIFESRFAFLRAQRHRNRRNMRSEEHTSELQSQFHLVCRLLLEKKKKESPTPPPIPTEKTKPTPAP